MVPPLLLDVRPGHAVLDTCASPGSKTQQIIEILHGAAQSGGADADGRGLVVANDADNKRCHLLVSRASRLRSPRLVVCNHDARLLPEHLGTVGAVVAAEDAAAGRAAQPASWLTSLLEIFGKLTGGGFCIPAPSTAAPLTPLRFDRVLCDVPCSGDGTIRKMPAIWRRWSVGGGNALHRLQLQVAVKAVRLLKSGGRLVYSTCSLNPIENEAVVAAMLRTWGDATRTRTRTRTLNPPRPPPPPPSPPPPSSSPSPSP